VSHCLVSTGKLSQEKCTMWNDLTHNSNWRKKCYIKKFWTLIWQPLRQNVNLFDGLWTGCWVFAVSSDENSKSISPVSHVSLMRLNKTGLTSARMPIFTAFRSHNTSALKPRKMPFVPQHFLPLNPHVDYLFSQGIQSAVIFQLPCAKVNEFSWNSSVTHCESVAVSLVLFCVGLVETFPCVSCRCVHWCLVINHYTFSHCDDLPIFFNFKSFQ